MDRSQPHLMPAGSTERRDVICDECVHEKNVGVHPTGAWSRDRGDRADVEFTIVLSLDEDFAIVECPHGHQHGVVREGTERARNFGYA